MTTKLDFTSMQEALRQLEASLGYAVSDLAKKDPGIFLQFRMAAIQAFEYSYELSIKMLRRRLEEMEASAESVDNLAFPDMLRLAAERGLLDDPVLWMDFRKLRNLTSHSYDDTIAQKVYARIPDFYAEAKTLLGRLESA